MGPGSDHCAATHPVFVAPVLQEGTSSALQSTAVFDFEALAVPSPSSRKGKPRPAPLAEDELCEILQAAEQWAGEHYAAREGTLSVRAYRAYREAHPSVPAASTIVGRFDGWPRALAAAGLSAVVPKSDDFILDALVYAADAIYPDALSSREYESIAHACDFLPSLTQVKRHFPGGWKEAVERAELPKASSHPHPITQDDIIDALHRCAEESEIDVTMLREVDYTDWRGSLPQEELRGVPSFMTVRRLFGGSYEAAWISAVRRKLDTSGKVIPIRAD